MSNKSKINMDDRVEDIRERIIQIIIDCPDMKEALRGLCAIRDSVALYSTLVRADIQNEERMKKMLEPTFFKKTQGIA